MKALEEKLEEEKKDRLRAEMVKDYKATAGIDAATAEEWRPLEEDAEKFIGEIAWINTPTQIFPPLP